MSPLTFILLILISTTCARKSGGGRYSGRGSHGSHSYPQSTGYSGAGTGTKYTGGDHSYPASTGLSGHGQHNQQQNIQHTQNQYHSQKNQRGSNGHQTKTEIHHHYHYNPPQQITYGSHSLPVYQGHPPVYVYEYRNSGSRFDTLLTGLALYNLGKMSANHHHHGHYDEYRSNPGEICKLGVSKNNGDYEETRIDCKLMSSFIWEAHSTTQDQSSKDMVVVASVVNVTQTNSTANGTVTSSVTVTNSTVVDALAVKGPSLAVTPDMKCFLMRISRDSSVLKKSVDCGVLQVYATSSLRRNSSSRSLPRCLTIIFVLFLYNMLLSI